MNLKKYYYYLFYQLYKFYETAPSKWLSDLKASLSIDVLSYFIITSIFIYYKIFFNKNIHLGESNIDVIIIVLLVIFYNYFVFHYKNRWKEIIREFDQLPNKENKKGAGFVLIFVVFVITNLILSYYLMSQIDWSQYR